MRMMKKGLSVIVMACMLLCMMPSVVRAEETTDANGFTVDDTGTLVAYSGPGGAITIPDNVSAIASGVFASNTSITSVTIPSYVTGMGTDVFYNCTSLNRVDIQGNISSIPANTFYNCTSLGSVSISAPITSIGSQAFAECGALSALEIPGSVTSIGEKAFYDCGSLTTVTIPASVSSIGSNAFTGCTRLGAINVAAGNGTYASSDGCLYNKAMTKLIRCPEGKSGVTVSSGTVTIGSGSFEDCRGITSLTLPESVTAIEANAFTGSGISTIVIPASVTSIGAQSNWSPSMISGYTGTQAQTYATGNGITFQTLGNANTDQNTDNSGSGDDGKEDNSTPAPAPDNGNSGNNGNSGASVSENPNAAGNVKNSSSGATTISDTHDKDETPKTGDGINPVFFLCAAVLLVGVYFVLANKNKIVK